MLKFSNILYILVLSLYSVKCFAITKVNPISFGVLSAKTGVERFECLLKCHEDAVKNGYAITYEGIKSLYIEIPQDAHTLPLPDSVDFAGARINVLNNKKNLPLFSKTTELKKIDISPRLIDTGDCKNVEQLCHGKFVLCIEDRNPWIEQREGYDYGAYRKDLLFINNGIAKNKLVSGYENENSSLNTYYANADNKITFKNLIFDRNEKSSFQTFLIYIANHGDIEINNITINTPQNNELYGDAAITIENSANVILKDVTINGTYSQEDQFGYGISLYNVSMFTGERIYARARWGVFGNNNVNGTTLMNCDINRYDIHCYGRDVRCYNCKFTDLYNQFSSIYGDVYFEECTFNNFVPVLMESSYNAYTPFDITFKMCTFNLTTNRNFIITLLGLEEAHNSRPELSRKALPNITFKDCMVNLPDGLKEWYIVNTGKVRYKETLDYMSHISIDGLNVNQSCNFDLFSSEIRTTIPLKVSIKNMYEVKGGKRKKYVMPYATVDEKAKVRCNGKSVRRKTLADSVVACRYIPWAVGGLMLAGCALILRSINKEKMS